MAMSKLPLENGWQSSDTQFGTGDPTYSVSNGMVYLSGSLNQPAGDIQTFGVLPPAARPAHTMYLSVYTLGGAVGELEIDTNGDMLVYEGGAQGYTSLAGVSFPVASAATNKLTLINGWQSAQPPMASATRPTRSRTVWSTCPVRWSSRLPPATPRTSRSCPRGPGRSTPCISRPRSPPRDSFAAEGDIVISPDGRLYSNSFPLSESEAFTSLAGISYPVGS
jgi:hypothetical protein